MPRRWFTTYASEWVFKQTFNRGFSWKKVKNEFWRSQSKWCTADNVYCKPGPKSIIANCSITGGEAAGNGGQRLFKIQSNSARNHCENRMLQSGGVLRISGKNQNHSLSKRGGANNLNRDHTRWKSSSFWNVQEWPLLGGPLEAKEA